MNVEKTLNQVVIGLIIIGMAMLWSIGHVDFQTAVMTQLVMLTAGVFGYGERLKEGNDE